MPSKVRYHKETYRVNKKTPARIASRFGTITLRSFYYLNEEDGEPGLHPLRLRLGIGAGAATPALLERVARLSVDHTQAEVRAWLLREHGLSGRTIGCVRPWPAFARRCCHSWPGCKKRGCWRG